MKLQLLQILETFYDLPPNSTLNANTVKKLLGKCVKRTFNKLDFESKVESRLEPLVDEVFRRYLFHSCLHFCKIVQLLQI